ncbi:MAG TPA: AAA family ATPase [Oligoflexia bacterium]|nr:AAA family ATPase [Oligoflexia bacterium]HMP47979.1 AAA family ATPase [Oligoflexia bacterium]
MIRITRFYIDGFGLLSNYKSSLIESSFVLVYGENEVGKSTLFSFLRGMIAGFPPARIQKENKYAPVSGAHGGSIDLIFEDSSTNENKLIFTLEREAKKGSDFKIVRHSDNLTSIDDVNYRGSISFEPEELFRSLDRTQYLALFAFDLNELNSLFPLEEDALREKLFSATVSGSDDLITAAIEEFEKRSRELIRPKSKGLIQLLDEELLLKNIERDNIETELKSADFILKDIDNIERQISDFQSKLKILRADQGHIQHKIRAIRVLLQIRDLEILISDISQNRIPSEEDRNYFSKLIMKENIIKDELKVFSDKKEDNILDELNVLNDRKNIILKAYGYLERVNELNENINSTAIAFQSKIRSFTYTTALALVSLLVFLWLTSDENINQLTLILPILSSIIFVLLSLYQSYSSKRFSLMLDAFAVEKENHDINGENIRSSLNLKSLNEDDLDMINLETTRSLERLTFKHKSDEDKKRDLLVDLADNSSRIKDLLQSYSCASIEIFNERSGSISRLNDLNSRREELYTLIAREELPVYDCLGVGRDEFKNVSLIESFLEKIESEIIEKSKILENEIKEVEQFLFDRQNKLAELKNKLSFLFQKNDFNRITLDRNTLLLRLSELHRDWRVSTLSKYVLEKTLEKMVGESYREVISRASNFMSRVTGGRYTEILIQTENDRGFSGDFGIRGESYKKYSVRELSRGTLEQLYLSIRLSLAVHYGEIYSPLPILLDDILVNFDLPRARAIIDLLSEISLKHQIFLFTCHEWIRDLVKEGVGHRQEVIL